MGHHLKRLAAPRNWKIPRKGTKWTLKPSPGPHPLERAMPLGLALRDLLKVAETSREVRRVIGGGDVLVDGRKVTDAKFPISWMDVVSIPKLKRHWRMLVDQRGYLTLVEIDEKEAGFKLARVDGKTTLRGGLTQLNLHDGRNIVVPQDKWKTGDVLKLELPAQKVLDTIPFKEGTVAFVTGGRHSGETASIQGVEVKRITGPNLVKLKAKDSEFSTVRRYVFAVGGKRSEIKLPAARPGREGTEPAKASPSAPAKPKEGTPAKAPAAEPVKEVAA